MRDDLESLANADADARLRNNAIAKLIEENSFEVPNTLIESQARSLLNNFARDLQQRGVDLNKVEEDFLRMAYSQMQTQAERDVRGAMLLEKIAEAEKIEVADDEVDTEIRNMADHFRTTVEELRATFEKQNGLASIRNNLKTRKAIEALVDKAKVVEGPWVEETPGEPKEKRAEKPKKRSATGSASETPRAAKKKSAK
jgi:trigger factor